MANQPEPPRETTWVNTDHECSPSPCQHHFGTPPALSRTTAHCQHQSFPDSQTSFHQNKLVFIALTLREILQPRHARCSREFRMCLAQPRAVSVSNLTLGSCFELMQRGETSESRAEQLLPFCPTPSMPVREGGTQGSLVGARGAPFLPFFCAVVNCSSLVC